jgi:hypothetical protein
VSGDDSDSVEETEPKLCVPHYMIDLSRSYNLIMELEKDHGIFGCQRLAAYKSGLPSLRLGELWACDRFEMKNDPAL